MTAKTVRTRKAQIILRCMKNDTRILKVISNNIGLFTLIFKMFLLIMMIDRLDDDINMAPEMKVKPLIWYLCQTQAEIEKT